MGERPNSRRRPKVETIEFIGPLAVINGMLPAISVNKGCYSH